MSVQQQMFGYCRHTSPALRADKMNRAMGTNHLLLNAVIRFVREDEP